MLDLIGRCYLLLFYGIPIDRGLRVGVIVASGIYKVSLVPGCWHAFGVG